MLNHVNNKSINKKLNYNLRFNNIDIERPNILINTRNANKSNYNLVTEYSVRTKKTESNIIHDKNSTESVIPQLEVDIKDDMNYSVYDVYIISNIYGGGTMKYKRDIVSNYTNVNFIEVNNAKTLSSIKFKMDDILFVQQLLFSDIVPLDIVNIKNMYGSKIIIAIHDYCWFTGVLNNYPNTPYYHYAYLVQNLNIHCDIIKIFDCADLIIHPSLFTYEQYSRWFNNNNFIISAHNDYLVDYSTKRIPIIYNKQINIGLLHEYSEYKGSEIIDYLLENMTQYKDYILRYVIVGKNVSVYNEGEFYDYIKRYNITFLLLLNKWGETYCYSLTKYINSGLPILYNDIGAFKERIPKNIQHYKSVIEQEKDYDNINSIIGRKLIEMLEYVIKENGKYNIENTSTIIKHTTLYNNLFSSDIRSINYSDIHKKVKPFCIYFPQFHQILENDKNYYPGMTDITNLQTYLQQNKNINNLMTPSKNILGLTHITDYNLTNPRLIQRQVDIAKLFGIYGFAIYYYWFSINSISNRHLIMERCFNNFFNGEVNLGNDFKVYFIWANEDWSNNPAFNTTDKIYNIYDAKNYAENIKTLIGYFKHINYYKIDNKPVFYVHHPWCIPISNLYMFKHMLNKECINAGFNGINLVVNNMQDQTDNLYVYMNKYNHYPDYKKRSAITDYFNHFTINEVINNISVNYPASMFFDFNNTARLYIPNKLNKVTIIKNTNYHAQSNILNILLSRYKNEREEINKIILFNSWNEWGENMAIEPSNEKGYAYLNMIKFALLRFM